MGGFSAMFSVDTMSPVSKTLFETKNSKLRIITIELAACLTALEVARSSGYRQVKLVTSSALLQSIITSQLQIWKKKNWRRPNGNRLVIPVKDLKRLDHLLVVLAVEVVRVARGSCPEIVRAEARAKQSLIDFSESPTLQNTNVGGAGVEEPHVSQQMERKIASAIKQRKKEHCKRKLKRLKIRGMRPKVQLN